ncbi:MAG: DNA translocase FtsK, partial [Gemmatimonadota bacterium]
MVTERQRRQLLGLASAALALFVLLSLLPADVARHFPAGNVMGPLGALTARWGLGLFGIGMLIIPVALAVGAGWAWGRVPADQGARWVALLLGLAFLLPAAAALWIPETSAEGGMLLPPSPTGFVGRAIGLPLVALLGPVGAGFVLTVLLVGLVIATIGWSQGGLAWGGWGALRAFGSGGDAVDEGDVHAEELPPSPWEEEVQLELESAPEADAGPRPVMEKVKKRVKKAVGGSAPVLEDSGDPESADRPPMQALSAPPPAGDSLSSAELDRLGETLIATLRTFKVEGEIGGRTTGPVVTQFEVVPAPGVKVNRIAALDADLALALRAPSIRIVAPIPGKGAVGVEVPNPSPEVVHLRDILEAPAFQRARGTLPLALGKDLMGRPYVADLARMPHLLIAGATGSGKSVCINTIITSLIYRHSPRQMRLLMVDPKMVELSMYGDLPHLRHPVVTDPQDAATILKWAVMEMERRYTLLSENGARSLAEFNRRAESGQELRRAFPSGSENDPDRWAYTEGPLPYIVVVVDELADLMMTVQAEVERPLAQLAQKARAIGMHLIVATQRPSVNVITGLIKANFPCRIGFRVSSKVDSRTILDQNGADALLGNGDMLFLPPGQSDPVRIQGAYISTEDTERLMN